MDDYTQQLIDCTDAEEITPEAIEKYRSVLVLRYECDDTEIQYDFEAIEEAPGVYSEDNLTLNYILSKIKDDVLTRRIVAHQTVRVPEHIKLMAREYHIAQKAQ